MVLFLIYYLVSFGAEDLMEAARWLCVCGLVIAALLPVGWQMVLKDSTDESR